jgi:hypothetical protein
LRSAGTAELVAEHFRADLAAVGYPREWLAKVQCHFASKEVVDRNYEGSYYLFLR